MGWFQIEKSGKIPPLLLMEKIPNNHRLDGAKTMEWDKLPSSTGAGFQPSTASLPFLAALHNLGPKRDSHDGSWKPRMHDARFGTHPL